MKGRRLLLTGATGVMGGWVLREALDRGYTPSVVMRDDSQAQARERLAAVLGLVDREDALDSVAIYRGDTRKPFFGLATAEAASLRENLGGIIHCAACTSFDPKRDEEVWDTNVNGVRNILEFVKGTGIHLYHVSTAYLSGTRQGRVFEADLDQNQTFHNTYERSKLEGERQIHKAFESGRTRGAIFRPSIIVGDVERGAISQFQNFYNFLRLLDMAATGRFRGSAQMRVVGNPDATKNLVTVDWTAKALWHIIDNEGPSNQVYHLTNNDPISLRSLETWTRFLLEPAGFDVRLVRELEGDISSLEAIFETRFKHYRAYFEGEPIFDRTNTDRALDGALPLPEFGPELYTTLLAYARECRWSALFAGRGTVKPKTSVANFPVEERKRPAAVPAAAPECVEASAFA